MKNKNKNNNRRSSRRYSDLPKLEVKPKLAFVKDKKSKEIGSSRGVETLFRSAFRTQMDMLSLAAVKANIMITINGLIASALVVSGALIYATEPLFLPPACVFLITSVISIYFAIQAASPVSRRSATNFKGVASLQDFKEGEANELIFEDYAHLSKEEYMECMVDLLQDNKKIYTKMIGHLHWLGVTADRKFKMLRYAYSVFRGGIILAILILLIMQLLIFNSGQVYATNDSAANNVGISKFESIYEPSGIQQLSDGRIIVVEDDQGLKIISFQEDGRIVERNIFDLSLNSATADIADLEGVAVDAQEYIYVVTSHSRTKNKGIRKAAREQLIRFRVEGGKIVDMATFSGLRDYFEQAEIFAELGRKKSNDLNIEAISFDKEKKRLLIGFRFPRIGDKAVIAILENPEGIFERHEELRFSDKIIYLDLHGKGIRSLTYDAHLDGYLLTNEIRDKNTKEKYSRLWFWSGNPGDNPRAVSIPGLKHLENAEGVTTVKVGNVPRIFIVGDNGNAKKGKPASYLLGDYEQLSID